MTAILANHAADERDNDTFLHTEFIQVPAARLAMLVGRKGVMKQKIEAATASRLRVAETVEITGPPEGVFLAKNVVKAIARGFDPSEALLLADEETELTVISLGDESKRTQQRLFGRVIGRAGQAKKNIEKTCRCHIAVYGKTVSVISHLDDHKKATLAVENLLAGHTHAYVYKRLGEREPL